MKETYSRPTVTNVDIESNTNEVLPIVGMAAGYAAGRVITKAMDARPSIKRPALTPARRVVDDI